MTTKTAKQIETAIASIAERGATLQADIQETGLDVLAHIDKHSEVSLLNKLFKALPVGTRRDSFVVWALQFGKCAQNIVDPKKGVTREDCLARPFIFDKDALTDLDGATDMKWYEAKKPTDPFAVFDVAKALSQIMSKATKAQKEGRKITGLDKMQEKLDLIAKLGDIEVPVPAEVDEPVAE